MHDSPAGESQMVRFQHPVGDSEPYLNAGPGRIPSSQKRLLHYLRKFGVPIETYVMNFGANLVQMSRGPEGNEPIAYRRLEHNTRGWIAEMVYAGADELVQSKFPDARRDQRTILAAHLRDLMITFGELVASPGENLGKYIPSAGEDGKENALARAGYEQLPGVHTGKIVKPLQFDTLLRSEYWLRTRFIQPEDFLWQPTLFQPVGGMDRVQHAFAQKVAALGGNIYLNSPVSGIDWDAERKEFVVQVQKSGSRKFIEYRSDYCFSNIAIPFLKKILSKNLLDNASAKSGLEAHFKAGLNAVFAAQFKPTHEVREDGYMSRFLANTTKVGWQAERELWQGGAISPNYQANCKEYVMAVPDSEVGVVPIFGGIFWTDHEIRQIWYPSNSFNDQKGVLTGAYNFSGTAFKWGQMGVQERLRLAKSGARKFGKAFADGLQHGVAIAWQNMPYIKGGWAQWHVVEDAVKHFNTLDQGSGVYDKRGRPTGPVFFIVGDQVSSLPGWQEGAIAAALNAISRIARPDLAIPHLSALPDTRLMVEGI